MHIPDAASIRRLLAVGLPLVIATLRAWTAGGRGGGYGSEPQRLAWWSSSAVRRPWAARTPGPATRAAAADYGPLNQATSRNRINLALITENWNDITRLAASLQTGTVRASQILRVTQGAGTATRLGRAVAEYGRIAKTLHLLAFVDTDDTYRRQIHRQLTVQESRHALARRVFHGKHGQIYQTYREGQEDQLGALGLVLNATVLWNTVYLDAATRTLDADDEDLARLWPLISEHINLLGRYAFPTTASATNLRPLRDPTSDGTAA